MRVSWRDGLATVAAAAAVVVYVLWTNDVAFGGLSVRALSVVVFVLGFVGCTSDAVNMTSVYAPGPERTAPMGYTVSMSVLGLIALASGIAAMVGGSETTLGVLVVAIVALWAMATLRHAFGARLEHATP